MKKFLKKYFLLILILLIGLFFRVYGSYANLAYSHDQDLEGWFVRDVVINHHPRLIGQETSTQGIFIGALYYYLLVPFYLIFNMDPVGGIYLATILGLFSIFSFYFVFKKIFNEKIGLIASFLYAVSFATIYNDRGVVPTTPVFLWTIWYLYGLNLLLREKYKKGLIILGFLVGLIWHLNVALVLLTPLIVIALYLSRKKLDYKKLFWGAGSFLVTSIPFLFFEIRHDFSQTRYVITSFTVNQGSGLSTFSQFQRLIHIATQNATSLLYNTPEKLYRYVTILYILLFVYLYKKRLINKKLAIILTLWQVFYILFFTFYSKVLSEYYLNGMTLVWIVVLSVSFSVLYNKSKYLAILVAVGIIVVSFYRLKTYPFSQSEYQARRQIVQAIKQDATNRGFTCVSVSYITNPGYDRGYRYLYWLEKLKLKPISEKIPVYTIVFPLKPIFAVDKTFGTIGLIYPDYKHYTEKIIQEACGGDDFNLTDPMIGFTN